MTNIYYLQVDLICLVILYGILGWIQSKKIAQSARAHYFSHLVVAAIVMCFSDIYGWVMQGQTWTGAWWISQLANIIYFASTTYIGYAWYYYVTARVKGNAHYNRERTLRDAFPLVLMLALLITNPLTEFVFSLNEQCVYTRGDGVIFHWIISYGYLLLAAIRAIYALCKAGTKLERDKLKPLIHFFILPFIGTLLQVLFCGLTVIPCGITLGLLMIFVEYLQGRIMRDPLTGLNNRAAMDQYISGVFTGHPVSVSAVMCDIDLFKRINDTCGHAKGDYALQCVADALKQALEKGNDSVFLCRYGGDEFVMCGLDLTDSKIEALSSAIVESLKKYDREFSQVDGLHVSFGIAAGLCTTSDDYEKLLNRADEEIYRCKNVKKEKFFSVFGKQ